MNHDRQPSSDPPDAVGALASGPRGAAETSRVLVIGGAGYLGSLLVRRLLALGRPVRVMDALVYGDESIRELYEDPHFEFVDGDLRDLQTMVATCRDVGAIVHLGALVGDPACALDERLTVEVNLEATRRLASVACDLGIQRLVFASTCSVYGESQSVVDEDSPIDPMSLYARTKGDCEAALLSTEETWFAPVVLRFGTFFGLSPRLRFDLVVNLLAAKAVTERAITIVGGGQWRPFIHVWDGAEAIVRCLQAPLGSVSRKVFNVGSDEQNHTLSEIGQIVASQVPGTVVRLRPQTDVEASYRVSFARIRTHLGFRPAKSVADGVNEIKTALENGAIASYTDDRFSNVKSLAASRGWLSAERETRPVRLGLP